MHWWWLLDFRCRLSEIDVFFGCAWLTMICRALVSGWFLLIGGNCGFWLLWARCNWDFDDPGHGMEWWLDLVRHSLWVEWSVFAGFVAKNNTLRQRIP